MIAQIREKVIFQKRAVDKLKREISITDKKSGSRYIREFSREFKDYEELSSKAELMRDAQRADIIYIGDYHTLEGAQRFAANLIEELAGKGRGLIVGLEIFYGRNQRALDQYLRGEIDEDTFLRRVRFDLEWGCDWESYRAILQVTRRYNIPTFGLDSYPRYDMRLISRRDYAAAKKMVDLVMRHPDTTLVVVIGESHLASNHLPGKTRHLLNLHGVGKRDLVIVQNIDSIYWKLAQKGLEQTEVVKVGHNKYCVFNASPLAKYQSYRQTIEIWQSEEDERDLSSTVYGLIDTLLSFLKVNKFNYCLSREERCLKYLIDDYPEVYSDGDGEIYQEILLSQRLDTELVCQALDHIERFGSCFVPRINAIFIKDLDIVRVAEEAAHFVRHAFCRELYEDVDRSYPTVYDRFYALVIAEALAYFSSKLICPNRAPALKPGPIGSFKALHPSKNGSNNGHSNTASLIDFLEAHDSLIAAPRRRNRLIEHIEQIMNHSLMTTAATDYLGSHLGQRLYDLYNAGKITRLGIKKLFFKKYQKAGSALRLYQKLTAQP